MKLLSIIKITIIFFLLPIFVNAQDCERRLKNRLPEAPYEYSDQSIGDYCETGETYNFTLPLQKTLDYKLKFYASAIFNRKINFEIRDKATHKTIMKLSGNEVLAARYDEKLGKEVYPAFEFRPRSATTLEIIMVTEKAEDIVDDDGNKIKGTISKKEGCITLVVLQKPSNRRN